jgi:ADP-ribose pyrophosphatase
MSRIRALKKLTDRRWLNLYEVLYLDRAGNERSWDFASRKQGLDLTETARVADAVVIVPTWLGPRGERKLVLTREFRAPIRGYEWAFPAGLVEAGEPLENTAIRELREETGLTVDRVTRVSPPLISSAGLSDETSAMVFVDCSGTPSLAGNEASEDIEVHLLELPDIDRLMADKQVLRSAKAWPLLFAFQQLGRI